MENAVGGYAATSTEPATAPRFEPVGDSNPCCDTAVPSRLFLPAGHRRTKYPRPRSSRSLPLFSTSDAGLHILPTDQEESDAVLEAHVWKPIWAKRSE